MHRIPVYNPSLRKGAKVVTTQLNIWSYNILTNQLNVWSYGPVKYLNVRTSDDAFVIMSVLGLLDSAKNNSTEHLLVAQK
jgi:hypothetical protein